MSVTQIDLDDAAVAETMRLSGLRTKKDAVNLALNEYVSQHRRIEALERFGELAKTWDYESWQRLRADERAVDA